MTEKTIAAMTSSGKDDWETPRWLFEQLNGEFHFTLDPCCTHETAKCSKHYTPQENGLLQDWGGGDRFLQPALFKKNQHQSWTNCVGTKMRSRGSETRHNRCGTPARTDRYGAFSLLHLRKSGNPLSQRPHFFSGRWKRDGKAAVRLNDLYLEA